MKNMLWLPGWYPNRTEPYTGDFIQRHARAASLYCRVRVIHVLRDKEGMVTKQVLEETQESGNLEETVIYYYSPSFWFSPLEKLCSFLRYMRLYKRAIRAYITEKGLPAGVHVHIINKNGWLALWLKRKFGIRFVVSEHWTAYLKEAKPGFDSFSLPFKWMWARIVNAASGFSAVSRCLGNALQERQKNIRFSVIPNVVDSSLFFPLAATTPGPVHFIHISTLSYQKNPEAILQAFALIKRTRQEFRLSVFGPPRPDLQQLAATLGLGEELRFYEEVPQAVLAGYVQQADALVLYSRYETFGCVLIEANACGVPAIVSDIPVHHETIEEGVSGYFAAGDNAAALAAKLSWFMQHAHAIPREALAAATREKYHYERVGKLFDAFYRETLEPGGA